MSDAPDPVFVTGPGGIGKTSSGPILAERMMYQFFDLDEIFMDKIGHIGSYIHQNGYATYVRRNSGLFFDRLESVCSPSVFILSSGFLIAETEFETVARNRRAVLENGCSVMPLPCHDIKICAEIVTEAK
ncbi:MAG: shikimate kinase [Pseudomonadota bacterium]